MKLKMCTTGKIFAKISLKAIRICGLQSRERRGEVCRKEGELKFCFRVTSNRMVSVKILGMSRERSLVPSLVANPDPENPEECAWSDYCNNFEISERECFL